MTLWRVKDEYFCLMGLQFQHPDFFIALLVIPFLGLLFWYLLRWKKTTIRRIGDVRLVEKLTQSHSPINFKIRFIAVIIAMAAIIITIINPGIPGKMDKVERKGVDVMIALDVSNSMLAEDVRPNRLEKAKELIGNLLNALQNDRFGLIVFAGRAYMQMPLTTDHGAARIFVQNAGPRTVNTQGTMISEALRLGAAAFNSKERKYKSIILITDGEDHDPASLEIAEQLYANGVMVNTVGIGSSKGTPVPDFATGQPKKDAQGNTIISRLNEDELKQIANITKGVYVNNDDVDKATAVIMKKLSTIQEVALEDTAFKDYRYFFQWFALAAFILLLVDFLLPERKLKMTGALLLLVVINVNGQSEHIIRGNQLYKNKSYEEALKEYKKTNDPSSKYNAGNAYFRMQQYEDARNHYEALIVDSKAVGLQQRAYYNEGVSLSKQNKLEESIVAYKKALMLDPNDEDARINLQKALLELKKKQPPQQKEDNKNNKEKNQHGKEPPPTNLNKKEVDRLLKALQQREQQVQQKIQENKTRNSIRPEKDW